MDHTPPQGQASEPLAWEAADPARVLYRLASTPRGLSAAEAAKRLSQVGRNELPEPVRRSGLLRFLDQFRSVLVYVLVGAAGLTAALGHWLDTAVIVAVVVANAVIGWLQEGRAERALAAVGRLLAANATVLRDGAIQSVPAPELVPGDIVVVQSGDRIPADIRLIEARSFAADESVLTGESVPVAKSVDAVAQGLPLGDRSSMAFSGTIVSAGQANGVVVATGRRSELGRIGNLVGSVEQLQTPLLRRLSKTSRQLTFIILGFAALTMAVGLVIGVLPIEDLFLAAVGLAVAAIPEGLPAVVTIILAIGVRRMAARGALVRRLPAVETLGSVTVICTDKTGTLTRNELAASEVQTADGRWVVQGEGYSLSGQLVGDANAPDFSASAALSGLLATAALCNDAQLRQEGEEWRVTGDPIEGALLALCSRAGHDPVAERAKSTRIDALPFESDHRYMATLDRESDDIARVHLKGAPEQVLALCAVERTDTGTRPLDRVAWHERAETMAGAGLRVLAFAASVGAVGDKLDRQTIGANLAFLGLVGFIDPARPEAVRSVAACREAGILVKMITGDHAATALAIGSAVGLDVAPGALTGTQLAALEGRALIEAAERVNVFARVDPAQKLRLVEALQAAGHIVAMTGDGVNDAPALRRADIGVAMGRKGSDAAKEAAEIVLVDDNFATIANAVREGRTVDGNLRKSLAFILPTNAGESLLLGVAILIGATLPITAIQIIWINLATEITLSLALAFEPSPDGPLAHRRSLRTSLISGTVVFRIVFVGVVMAGLATALFALATNDGRTLEEARSLAVNSVVASEVAYLISMATLRFWGRNRAVNWVALGMIAAVVALQLLVTQWLPAATALGIAPLGSLDWGLVGLSGVALFGLVELEKRIRTAIGRRNKSGDRAGAAVGRLGG